MIDSSELKILVLTKIRDTSRDHLISYLFRLFFQRCIRNYAKQGYLKISVDRAKRCRDQLKEAQKLSTMDHQRVTCQILRHHFNKVKIDFETRFRCWFGFFSFRSLSFSAEIVDFRFANYLPSIEKILPPPKKDEIPFPCSPHNTSLKYHLFNWFAFNFNWRLVFGLQLGNDSIEHQYFIDELDKGEDSILNCYFGYEKSFLQHITSCTYI